MSKKVQIKRKQPKKSKQTKLSSTPAITRAQVDQGYQNWIDRPDSPEYWAGMDEREWDLRSKDAAKRVWENAPEGYDYRGRPLRSRYSRRDEQIDIVKGHFPKMVDDDVTKFIDEAEDSRFIPKSTRHHRVGVPHAGASETQWVNNLSLSGKQASRGNTGLVTDTDLLVDGNPWDVQDVFWDKSRTPKGPQYNLSLFQGLNSEQALEIWRRAPNGTPMEEVFDEIRKFNPNLMDDKLFSTGKGLKKDMLIGNVRDVNTVNNVMGIPKRGSYNPDVGAGEYMLDLGKTKEGLLKSTKGELIERGGTGVIRGFDGHKLKLSMPLTDLQDMGGSKGLIEKHVSPEVLKHMDDIGIEKGYRTPGGTRFHGTFLPTDSGPRLNLKSGARMAGEKLVKTGVITDVAITGGLSYLTGESDNVAEAAWAGATSLIPDAGGTANIKDIGGKLYSHDESTNMITPLGGGKTQGLAYKDGKPVAVDYGSLKGRTSMIDDVVTPIKAIGQSIVDTHQRRQSERKPISTVGKTRYTQKSSPPSTPAIAQTPTVAPVTQHKGGARAKVKAKPARPSNGQGWWNQALGALGLQ